LIHNILGSVDKPIVAGHCMFPLANPHKGQSLGFVPESNSADNLILLYICSANQTKSRTQDMVCGFFNLRRVEKG
jgi:hypothetical protein